MRCASMRLQGDRSERSHCISGFARRARDASQGVERAWKTLYTLAAWYTCRGKIVKFRLIFILFNVVIVVSFLIIYFMPLAMLGWEYTRVFWSTNWGLPLLFIGIIGILNAYFVFNWKLFHLLEAEDWRGLINHLEHRIYEKNIILAQQVRILVNAYLVQSNVDAIEELEQHIRAKRPRLMRRLLLVLGLPYMLRNDPDAMEGYYGEFIDVRGRRGRWARWNYAFALMLQGKHQEARDVLVGLAEVTKNSVLKLLVLYLLDSLKIDDPGAREIVVNGTERLRSKYSRSAWTDEVDRARSNVQVVILARLVDEATEWLFREDEPVRVEPDEGDVIH